MVLSATIKMHTYRKKVVYNVLKTISNSYNTKLTVTVGPKDAGVRFCNTITIATQIESCRHISIVFIAKIQTNKQTAEKVRSIFPRLVWHTAN